VRIGFFLNTQDPPMAERIVEVWEQNLRLAEIGDEEGLDWIGLGEHHFRDDAQMPAPLVAAAAIAARTRRIGIVTTISIGTLWQPLRLAEEAAVVDVLSAGRFTLGLGLGNYEPELTAFGVAKRDQARVFEEVLDIVDRATAGERFSYEGRFFRVPELRVTPIPVQRPFPVWLGGMSAPGVERAARRGRPLLLDPLHTIDELVPWVERYRAACATHGTRADVRLLRYGWVSEDPDEARDAWWPMIRDNVWNYFVVVPRFSAEGSTGVLREARSAADLPMEPFVADRFLVGDPAEAADRLADWGRRLGTEDVLVKLEGEAGPRGEPTERAVRALAAAKRLLA